MPRTKNRTKPAGKTSPAVNETGAIEFGTDVLKLAEAAAYLRLTEAEVRRLVEEQGLPARQLGEEWRFLKSAIQTWLSVPATKEEKKDIWSAAGSWKDDPYLDEMLKEIDRKRGQPMTEE